MTSPVVDWLHAHLQSHSLSLFDREGSESLAKQWTVECHDNVHMLDWNKKPVWSVLELAKACDTLSDRSLSVRELSSLQRMLQAIITRVEEHRVARRQESYRVVTEGRVVLQGIVGSSRVSIKDVVLPALNKALSHVTQKLQT